MDMQEQLGMSDNEFFNYRQRAYYFFMGMKEYYDVLEESEREEVRDMFKEILNNEEAK